MVMLQDKDGHDMLKLLRKSGKYTLAGSINTTGGNEAASRAEFEDDVAKLLEQGHHSIHSLLYLLRYRYILFFI